MTHKTMSKTSLDSDLVRQLASLLDETGLCEIEIEQENFKIRVAKSRHETTFLAPSAVSPAPQNWPAPANDIKTDAEITASHPGAVNSPMVGNAYLSPRPGAPAFIKVGDTVQVGQTLLIIEAMKVMNPIPAAKSGTVTRILITDGQPVEYNEVLLVIE